MEPVPSIAWLLDTYARAPFSRIDELRAKVTSTFGSILKMDSNKKSIKKLPRTDAGNTQCMTSVVNKLGEVLMAVLTEAEGYGLVDRQGVYRSGTVSTSWEGPSTGPLCGRRLLQEGYRDLHCS